MSDVTTRKIHAMLRRQRASHDTRDHESSSGTQVPDEPSATLLKNGRTSIRHTEQSKTELHTNVSSQKR